MIEQLSQETSSKMKKLDFTGHMVAATFLVAILELAAFHHLRKFTIWILFMLEATPSFARSLILSFQMIQERQ